MGFNNFIKKGISKVETVVIVASVVVATAVATGLYFGISASNNKSVDEQIVTEFNKILERYEARKEANKHVEHVRHIFEENGMSNFKAFYNKNSFYWTLEDNRILIWNENEKVTFPSYLEAKYADVTDVETQATWYPLYEPCIHPEAIKESCNSSCPDASNPNTHLDNDHYRCSKCGTIQEKPMASVEKHLPSGGDKNYNVNPLVVDVNPVIESGGDLTSLKFLPYQVNDLDVKYTFGIAKNEENNVDRNKYKNYTADFVVSFTKDGCSVNDTLIKKDSFGLWGIYDDWNIAFPAPFDLTADSEFMLLNIAGGEFSYEDIINEVTNFSCGAWNYSPENKGVKMIVRLCLWEEGETEKTIQTADHIVGKWTHEISGENHTSKAI